MNPYKRVCFTILCSVSISLVMMSLASNNELTYREQERDAMSSSRSSQLSEQNIVDYVLKVSLQLKVAKISWQQSILSVDLITIPGNSIDAMVYHDLFELSQFGLRHVTNVSQVRVRVIQRKDAVPRKDEVLLAMDSRKENIENQKEIVENLSTLNQQKYLQSHFRMTYTQKWYEQFVD